jgi:hypothetical protein
LAVARTFPDPKGAVSLPDGTVRSSRPLARARLRCRPISQENARADVCARGRRDIAAQIVPCGTPTTDPSVTTSLLYNEFIVYNTAQARAGGRTQPPP